MAVSPSQVSPAKRCRYQSQVEGDLVSGISKNEVSLIAMPAMQLLYWACGMESSSEMHRPQPAVSFATAKETKSKVFDRKFFVLAGVAAAATAFDVTTTSRCMSTYVDCREGNPLLGAHPSTARLYGVSFSILGGQLFASAWLRRKTPNGKLWMAPPIITAAGHGMAAVLNLRTMHQLQQQPVETGDGNRLLEKIACNPAAGQESAKVSTSNFSFRCKQLHTKDHAVV